MDTLVSELARVTSGERTRAEECGYLLSKTHASQVFLTLLSFTISPLIISIYLMLPRYGSAFKKNHSMLTLTPILSA